MVDQENDFERLERALVRAGRAVDYPPTPAIAARARQALTSEAAHPSSMPSAGNRLLTQQSRRVMLTLAAAIVLALALLLALPEAREAVAQFLGLRGLRIFYVTPTPSSPLTTATPLPGGGGQTPSTATRAAGTPTPTVQPFALCCEMSLHEAQVRARFKLRVPPAENVSRVYYQSVYNNGEQVVMLFGDPEHPRFTLYQAQRWIYGKLVDGALGKGIGPATLLQETVVDGQRALWFSGAPHVVMVLDAHGEPIYSTARTVDANTLVWETGNDYDGIIYRVETKLSLEDAVRFAASLK